MGDSVVENAIVSALVAERDKIAELEAELLVHRELRDSLMLQLRKRGWVLRAIEPLAGVSNVYINRLEKRNNASSSK